MADQTESRESLITDSPLDVGATLPDFIDLLPSQLQPYWQFVQKQPLLEATLIAVLFFCLAFVISRYAITLIQRLTLKTDTNLDDQLITLVRSPILKSVSLFGLLVGIKSAEIMPNGLSYIAPIIGSYLVIIWTRFGLSTSSLLIHSLAHSKGKLDERMEPLIIICSKVIIVLLCCYLLLIIWGINPMGLLASAGIVGIAVGFAAKDTLANLFSGVFILADTPYKLGEYINLDSGERGKVTHIGIRSTRLLTRDDIEITIPNGIIGNAKVVNEHGGPWKKMRIRLNGQCAYESDLDQVCEVLQSIADNHDEICKSPAARVRIRSFADSGINFQLMCWIEKPEDRGRLLHELYMQVHKKFKENNIEIPYPKREYYVHKP